MVLHSTRELDEGMSGKVISGIGGSFCRNTQLKELGNIVVAKHKNAPKVKISEIPKNMTINEKNKLQIDKISASRKSPRFIK